MFIAELTSYGQTVVSSQVIIDGIILLYDYIDDISSLSSISSYTQNLDEEACGNINKAIGNVRIYDASSSEYQAKTILFYIKDGNEKKIIAGYSQPTALIQKSGSPLTLFMSFDFSAFTHGFLFSSIQAGYGNASHNTDGIVHIENPDITTDDAFSVYSKLQTDALFEEAIEDATNDSHELIMGTQTASVAAWTGVTKRSALYVGMTINYFLPYAGKANSTLNLTLADGTTSGAIPIYFRGATAVGTHFPVGSLIQLTYLENITIGSTTINAGWFALSNYVDGNTTTYLSAAQPLKAGANGIWGRSLVMRTGADTWESIVLSYKSALAQHVLNTQSGFYTDTIFYNAGTSTVTSGNSSSATMYPVYNTITYTNYFLDTVTTPFVVGKPIYFVGTIHSDGKFYFNSPVYHAQEITTSDIYVFVGLAYSSTTLFLLPYHPMFTLKDGKIVEVTTHSLAIESEIPTNVSDLNNDAGYLTQHQDIKTINNNSLIGTGNVQLDLGDHNVIESISVNNTPQTITNKNVNITVPTNTNQLTNGAGFITSSDIPSNVSAFTNDAGYLTSFTETDPTVPSWAKASTKPTYTASEVGALPDDTFIPSNTTDLTNDAEFITASDIPSNVSAFTNDAGYLTSYTETDPTVPSWAKQTNKPSYTLDEVTDGTTRKLSDYVPTTRKVNNKALSADITLNLDDVADGSSRKLSNYIPYSEILSTINGFDNRRLWQYEIHNTLWAANKRYDVTLTGFNNNNASASLFDGSFETNVVVPKEGTGIILISGKNGSKMWGGGYPYGYLEVAFYYTNIPESVTCRVYSDWAQNPGWHNVTLTNVDKNNNQALYRGVNTGFYGVTQVEITINAKDSVTANVTEVAFYQTRGTLQQMAVFNKTVAQTLYHDLTGTKFIVSGGTQSQFLKADGSLDSNTYATSSQIPTKTSDLTNDSGYITSSALSGYAQTSSLKEGAYVDVDEITMTSSSDNLPTSKAVASYISSLNYATTSQIPTVNNAKLTIQRNGAQIAEFTANASSPVTANIEVPILGIKQNTTTLTPDANKIVTVTVPTTVSELSDSENYELKSNLKEGAYVDVDETTMTSSSDNLPTSKAVASYISGQGFLTQHQSLDGQVASAQYNSTDKTIEFYNASGTKLNTDIDATDFIKDGMVDTVEVTGGNLVITFNTDAGKEDIEIPITDIFNADDYYTKDDIDGFGFLTEHQSLDNCVQKVASTDNAITRFDGTGGTIQNSGVLIDDSNNLLLPLGSSSTFANNAKLAIGNAWFGSNTTGGLAYGTKSGSTYTSYYTFETTAFRPVSGRDNTIDIGTSQYRWKRLYLGTAISNGTYTYSLPSATGTLALTSQIPSNVSALTNDSGYLTSSDLSEGAFVDVDETTTTSTSDNLTTGKAVASYISSLNLATQSQIPTVNNAILTIKKNNDDTGTTFTANADTDVTANLGLHAVASSGSYNDLSNKPTIPTVNNSTITIKKNADDTGDSFTTNAASGKTINLGLHDVATSGDYDDLTNKPDINNATLTIKKNSSDTGTTFTANASQDVTANLGLHDVATSGSYNDLTNKPTIPTVNNATLTIQKNGTTVNTFTANASSPVTANITVPTTVVELSDSSDYVTQTELTEAISTPIIQAGNNISVSYSSSFIPSGYTQVEYITSTGSSYINTNIPPTDTTKVIIDAYTTSTGSFYLFGARATSSSTILFGQSGSATGSVISASVNGTSLQASTNGVAWTRSSTGQRYTIGLETNSGTFTYCVKDHTNSRYFEGTANYTLLGTQTTKIMLCAFNSSNILTGTTRIYQFEIYQNDTLAFKGIPCIRQSDGKYGLYDTVSESFFASVSSTGFSGSDRFVGTVEISAIDNKAVWGNITGTLSNQTDLNTALGLKANSADLATVATSGDYTDLTNTPTNVSTFTNDAGYLTEHQSLSGYVQKVANSTDNAIVRFDGSNSDIQNSLTKVLDDGTVKLPASRSTDAIDRPKFSLDTYWVGSEREGFVFGTEANLTDKKLYSLFSDAFYPLQKSSLGTSNYLWTNLYLGGSIYKNTYQQSLQSKSGTIALTSDIPTNTNQLTNGAGFITSSDIPTNVSAFTNDAGYLTSFTETDPTVPSWAKEQTKPSYTLDEVTDGITRKLSDYVPTTRTVNSKALSSNITLNLDDVADGTNRSIPTNTNQLTNGAGFITSSDLPTNHVTTDTVQTITALKTFTNGIDLGTYHTSASQSLSTQLTVWDDTTNYQGGIEVTGNFNPATEDEYNLGSSNFPWLNVYANSFVKSGGTSAQFLKADGSVDSNTYLTSSDLPSNHVTTDTAQEITGAKTIAEDKLKIGNTSTNEDIDDYVFKRGQEFIVGTQTSSTSLWKGRTVQPALYEGMCVNYFVPVASTSTTASLELTFPDNTTSGAIPVIRNAGGTVTSSHVGVGAVVQLTLLLNRTIGSTSYEKVWKMNEWYDSNTNTIGYQIRTNNTTKPVSSASGRYRLLFTSADGTKYVPANASTSTSSTATKTVTQTPIDPFGRIAYYGSTTVLSENGTPGTSTLYDQYNLTIGYSFTPITLTANTPVYIKCAPQANGSAIINSTSPMVQSLPSTNDGNIYIFLGIATSTTAIEMFEKHPIYYHDGTGIRIWIGSVIPTNTNQLTNGAGFITSSDLPTNHVTTDTAQDISGVKTFKKGSAYTTTINGNTITLSPVNPIYQSNTGTVISPNAINVGSNYTKIENSIGRSSGNSSFLTLATYTHSDDIYNNPFSYIDITANQISFYSAQTSANQTLMCYVSNSGTTFNNDKNVNLPNDTKTFLYVDSTKTSLPDYVSSKVPITSISVDGTTQTITNKNVDLHIPDDIYSSDFICSMTRTNVSGSGNLTISGTVGPFPTNTTSISAGTYLVRTRMQSTTASYSLTVTFGGGSYTLTTTNGVIDDTRTITLSSASTYSASVTQVNANTFIKVSMYEPDVVVETVGAAAVTNDYNDLDNIPTIGNGTLTIQKNGSNVATFTANNVANVTANITVPTTVASLSDASNYVTTNTEQSISALKKFNNGIDLMNEQLLCFFTTNVTNRTNVCWVRVTERDTYINQNSTYVQDMTIRLPYEDELYSDNGSKLNIKHGNTTTYKLSSSNLLLNNNQNISWNDGHYIASETDSYNDTNLVIRADKFVNIAGYGADDIGIYVGGGESIIPSLSIGEKGNKITTISGDNSVYTAYLESSSLETNNVYCEIKSSRCLEVISGNIQPNLNTLSTLRSVEQSDHHYPRYYFMDSIEYEDTNSNVIYKNEISQVEISPIRIASTNFAICKTANSTSGNNSSTWLDYSLYYTVYQESNKLNIKKVEESNGATSVEAPIISLNDSSLKLFENLIGDHKVEVYTSATGYTDTNILISGTNTDGSRGLIRPMTAFGVDIGTSIYKFNKIYANTFEGNATTATTATEADYLKHYITSSTYCTISYDADSDRWITTKGIEPNSSASYYLGTSSKCWLRVCSNIYQFGSSSDCFLQSAVSNSINYINAKGHIAPYASTSYDLGFSDKKWRYIYCTYLGSSDSKVTTVYATNVGTSSYPTDSIYAKSLVIPYGYCQTAADTANKEVTLSPAVTTLTSGMIILVGFRYGNTVASPKLTIDGGTTYKNIYRNANVSAGSDDSLSWCDYEYVFLRYNGSQWVIISHNPTALASVGTSITNILPSSTNTYNLGSSSYKWNYLYARYVGSSSYPITSIYGRLNSLYGTAVGSLFFFKLVIKNNSSNAITVPRGVSLTNTTYFGSTLLEITSYEERVDDTSTSYGTTTFTGTFYTMLRFTVPGNATASTAFVPCLRYS